MPVLAVHPTDALRCEQTLPARGTMLLELSPGAHASLATLLGGPQGRLARAHLARLKAQARRSVTDIDLDRLVAAIEASPDGVNARFI